MAKTVKLQKLQLQSILHPTCENILDEKVQPNSAGPELMHTDDTSLMTQVGLLFHPTHTPLVEVFFFLITVMPSPSYIETGHL